MAFFAIGQPTTFHNLQLAHLLQEDEAMASSSDIMPGGPIAVFYSDDTVWHERIPLWRASEGHWMIWTPDGDRYVEDLRGGAADGPSRVKVKGKDFVYWSRVGGPAYRFSTFPTDEEFRVLIKESFLELAGDPTFDREWRPDVIVNMNGKTEVGKEFLGGLLTTHRLPGKKGRIVNAPDQNDSNAKQLAMIQSVQAISAAGPGLMWVCCEMKDEHVIGEVIEVDPSRDIMMGSIGLLQTSSGWLRLEKMSESDRVKMVQLDQKHAQPVEVTPAKTGEPTGPEEEDSSDARTLFIDFDEQGTRFKMWRSVVNESRDFSYADWPFEGPSTVMHLLKQMHRNGGDARLWLQLWARQKNIVDTDRVMHEMRCLTDILYHGATFDQLNLPVLASMETASRRIQCIVEAYASGTGTPDWSNAKLYTCHTGPDDLVSPQLRSWAARKGKEEVELATARARMKELRKLPTAVEDSAAAAADGALPGAQPGRRGRGRGRSLEAPKST